MKKMMQKSHIRHFRQIAKITLLFAIVVFGVIELYGLYNGYQQRKCSRTYDEVLAKLKTQYFDTQLHPLFYNTQKKQTSALHSQQGDFSKPPVTRVPFRGGASDLTKLFAENLVPFLIDAQHCQILDYPEVSPKSSCPSAQKNKPNAVSGLGFIVRAPAIVSAPPLRPVPELISTYQQKIIDIGKSVGRLELASDPEATKYFWGTAFMIAKGIAATSCHTIEPLMKEHDGQLVLEPDSNLKLFIEFNDFGGALHRLTFKKCSEHEGMDIALFTIDDCDTKPCPQPVPLFDGDIHTIIRHLKEVAKSGSGMSYGDDPKIRFVLVGYADLEHPIDSISAEVYKPYSIEYRDQGIKFAIADIIAGIDDCNENIILDLATTTIGESGSILIYLPDASSENPSVIGMHTCCSEFFNVEKGIAPRSRLRCARVTRTFDNQALSMESVLNDPILGPIIKNNGRYAAK